MEGRIGRRRREVILCVSSQGAAGCITRMFRVSVPWVIRGKWCFGSCYSVEGLLSALVRTVPHFPGRCETSRGASEAPCPLAVYTVTKVRVA